MAKGKSYVHAYPYLATAAAVGKTGLTYLARRAATRAGADAAEAAVDRLLATVRATGGSPGAGGSGERRSKRTKTRGGYRTRPSGSRQSTMSGRPRTYSYRSRYKFRGKARYKRRRRASNMRLRYSKGMFRRNALNPVSNYRRLTVKVVTPLCVGPTSGTEYGFAVSQNGISTPALGFCVCAQPFVGINTAGTASCYGPVLWYKNGTQSSMLSSGPVGQEPNADIIDVMERYAAFRVAGMRVIMYLNPDSLDSSGAVENLFKNRGAKIECAWDPIDTVAPATSPPTTRTHNVLTDYPNPETFKRFPYNKRFIYHTGAYAAGGTRPAAKRIVLFSRKFRASGAPELITPSTTANTSAVREGGWDTRATYVDGIANAFDASRYAEWRAGKLHVWISPSVEQYDSSLTQQEWLALDATQIVFFGQVITYHDIIVKYDLDGMGRAQA